MKSYPRWVRTDENYNLREVAPNLYVGAMFAPKSMKWAAIIDLYGSSSVADASAWYETTPVVLRWQFDDGDWIPAGLLDTAEAIVRANVSKGPVLIHCQAGLSRSASVAYALLCIVWGLNESEAYRRIRRVAGFPRSQTLRSAHDWVRKKARHDAYR